MIPHRFRPAVAFALGVVALSGCGGSVRTTDVAASVGDEQLTFDTVDEVLGVDADATAVRSLVNRFTIDEALRADLAALSVETEPTDLATDGVAALDASIGERVQQWQAVPVDDLGDAETQESYESGYAPVACLAHILTETDEAADAALQRIEDGEAFADVASSDSIDTQSGLNGGSLGCVPESELETTFVDGFSDAAAEVGVGEVVGPVESEFGFHLVTRLPFDQLDQTGLLQVRLSLFDERYDIFVEPRIGQWTGFGEIVPLG